MVKAGLRLSVALPIALMVCPAFSARADFFDGARQTFQQDIPHFFQSDFPHFFQDDIPCAFGGQPTSHTKASCKSPRHSGPRRTGDDAGSEPAPQDEGHRNQEAPVYDQ